jgi:hypothetical protein
VSPASELCGPGGCGSLTLSLCGQPRTCSATSGSGDVSTTMIDGDQSAAAVFRVAASCGD